MLQNALSSGSWLWLKPQNSGPMGLGFGSSPWGAYIAPGPWLNSTVKDKQKQ